MDANIIKFIFIFFEFSTAAVGLLINFAEPYLPILLTRSYRYGKFNVEEYHPIAIKAEVPKRWFRHFYIFASPFSTCTLFLVLYRYNFEGRFPEIGFQILDFLMGSSRQPLVSAENATIAIILITIQCWKRLYETSCISVFSDKKLNIIHYIYGYLHYFGTIIAIIGEAKGFVKDSDDRFNWTEISMVQVVCIIIFIWSTYAQLRSNMILAVLRKNSKGSVVHTGYKIPNGYLFEYVSNPLQLTEILMYLILSIILWQSSTYHYVTVWVIINQMECALLTHWWYLDRFTKYPKSRKIIIPYLF